MSIPPSSVANLRLIPALLVLCLPLVSCTKEARKARVLSRAEAYFKAGQFDNAKVEYSNLLRLDPQSSVPYQRLGQIWFEEGAPLRAVPFLLKSKELAPNDLDNRLKLARTLFTLGRRTDGFGEALSVLEKSPGNAEAARFAAESMQTKEQRERLEQVFAGMPNDNASWQLALATAALRKGDREAATRAVETALTLDPKLAPAHLLRANLWLSEKQPAKAGEEFKLAAETAPPRSAERIHYAQFQVQSGAPDEAVKTLQSITAAAPDFLPAWLLLADLSLGKKNYDESLRLLANILNRDPENIDATIVQARSFLGKGEGDKASQALERLDAKYPNFGPLKLELARCYLQKNNPTQAISTLNQALSANPEFIEAGLLLAQINLKNGNSKAVVESMQPLIEKHPDLTAAKLLLADAYRVLGQLDEAADIFRDYLKTSPDHVESCLALGVILRQQKKNAEAREILEHARQLAPNNPLALIQLVDLDVSERAFDTAQNRLEEQLRTNPNSAMLHFLQGRVYLAQSKWDQAEASLTTTLKLNPNFTDAYEALAKVYLVSNKVPEAARQLEAVVERTPNDTKAIMSLGVLYEKMHNVEKARDAYEKVIAAAPDFAPALNNLAFIYADQLNQIDRAYQLAQKARALQPGDASIADTLGWILYKKRDYQQALTLLADATAKSPNDSEIRYHLGMCHYMMGETEAARSAMEQALKSPDDFPHKTDAQRRVALLSNQQTDSGLGVGELEAIVQQQPDDVLARVRLAEKYEASNSFKQAAAQYDEVLKLNPRFAAAVVKLAELYFGPLTDTNKALEYAKTARELSPGDAHATALLGRIAYQMGNYSWAYGLLRQSCDQLPNDPVALHALAWAAFSVGKTAEAMDDMQRVLKIAPNSAVASDARTWLAMMQLENSKVPPNGAGDEVAKVLKQDPNYAPALLAQASMASNNGDISRAAALYQQVIDRFPDFAPGQKRLAAIYARQPADLPKAYDLAVKARKNLPDDNELTRLLAEISYQRKDYARAVELFEESARKEPLNAADLYYMGICSLQTKDTEHAREALTNALANGLQDPMASDARRTLQEIK